MADLSVVELSDDLTHVALSGRLDILGVQAVELTLTSHTAARRRPAIVDLSGVEFIGSLGIGSLVRIARTLRGHGVGVVLLAPRERVDGVLRASSIDQIIPIAATVDEARQSLGLES